MSHENHPQYRFLKEAGMSHDQILLYISQNLGLRNKTKQTRQRQSKPVVPTAKEKIFKPEHSQKHAKKKLQENQDQFKGQYLHFMETSHSKMGNQWRSNNIKMLFQLAQKVYDQKGIVSILSIGQWGRLVQQLKQQNYQFANYSQKELLDIYLQNLLEYEFFINGERLQMKQEVDLSASLSQALFIEGKLVDIVNSESKGVEFLKQQIVVFHKGVDELGVKYQDINLAKIQASCADEEIEIRIQNPMDYGFNINRLTNTVHQMNIKQYCDYQKNYRNEAYKKNKFGQQLKNGKIFFGVNFEPEDLSVFQQLWKKLQNNFLGFRQQFDFLSYLDSDIPGCSSPQFYLKVKGCWTGGHQQNIAMCAVNINHGPDASQWFTIPYCQVQKIRKVLNQKFKCDLYKHEGLWYQKINWFIENGYPIKRILQRKGDIVVTGPGTLHWVRSYGVALQSAWNIFPKSFTMVKCALHRFQQNIAIGLEKTSIIPFKSLLLKYLDHQLFTMQTKTLDLVVVTLQQWMIKEERVRIQLTDSCDLGIQNAIEYRLGDLQSVCEICKQEVFNYYVQSWSGKGIACLQCLANNPIFQNTSSLKLYYKYNSFHLKLLFNIAQNRERQAKKWTLGKFCSSPHIGMVNCPKKEMHNRKRIRQNSTQCNHPDDDVVVQESITFHQKIQKIIQIGQALPIDHSQTVAELAEKHNILLKEPVRLVNVSTQTKTSDFGCELQTIPNSQPSKKFCFNQKKPTEQESNGQIKQAKKSKQGQSQVRIKQSKRSTQKESNHDDDEAKQKNSYKKSADYQQDKNGSRRREENREYEGRNNRDNNRHTNNNYRQKNNWQQWQRPNRQSRDKDRPHKPYGHSQPYSGKNRRTNNEDKYYKHPHKDGYKQDYRNNEQHRNSREDYYNKQSLHPQQQQQHQKYQRSQRIQKNQRIQKSQNRRELVQDDLSY